METITKEELTMFREIREIKKEEKNIPAILVSIEKTYRSDEEIHSEVLTIFQEIWKKKI